MSKIQNKVKMMYDEELEMEEAARPKNGGHGKRILNHPVTQAVLVIGGAYVALYGLGFLFRAAASTARGWNELKHAARSGY